jgi:hypothetical protein
VRQRKDARHDLVAAGGAGFPRVADGDDLRDGAARHRREALHLQHGLEDDVDLLGREARRRDDGHLATDAVVEDEVSSRHLADEARQDGDLDVLEVERDRRVLRADERREREQQGEEQPHRRS